MLRKLIIAGVVLGLIAVGVVVVAFLKPTAEASQPIAAVPLSAATQPPAPTATAVQATIAPETTTLPTDTPQAVATETPQQAVAAVGVRLFEIVPAESEARFKINEVLNGAPKTVIGVTDQVSGQISVDVAAPANTRIGVIQVNARTLTTDNEFRNRAIKNRILMTNDYEFITFTPAQILSLPDAVSVGSELQFQVSGDLTVRDATRQVTFDVRVTPVSETQLQGMAVATIRYADFGIAIPEVPAVTGVEDNVILEIDFVAVSS